MQNDRLDAEIRVNRFGQNQEQSFKLGTNIDWVAELLEEMQESLEKADRPDAGDLTLELELSNKDNATLGEHFVIKGRFISRYHTACVRCLAASTLEVDHSFACCFLPSHLEDAEEYEEATEVFTDDMNMDLYFTAPKGLIDLKELVHEQIFMTIEPLPLHSEDCKGLCMTCGANLNTDSCKHHPAS